MKLSVTVNKLNKRKIVPSKLPDKDGIVGVVVRGFQFEGEEVQLVPNPAMGKWYVDRDGYFYWGGGLSAEVSQPHTHSTYSINTKIPVPSDLPANCVLGADVSHYNSKPDWQAMVDASIRFVIIKVSEGVGTRDKMALTHATNAVSAGLQVGYYHFCRPDSRNGGTVVSDATAEANEAITIMKSLPAAQLPLTLDLEDAPPWDTKLSPQDYLLWIKTFISEVSRQHALGCMIYSRAEYLNRKLPPEHDLGNVKLWISRYGLTSTKRLQIPHGWNDWYIWQFTEKGEVGKNAKIDLNVMRH